MREIKDTRVHLVADLMELQAGLDPNDGRRALLDEMVKEAQAGEYHDYKNEKYACGKFESATRLDSMGFHNLSARIKNGEYDEEADEADKAEMRTWLPEEAHKIFGIQKESE